MVYAPHYKLRAFDTLSDEARIVALVHLLEGLSAVSEARLREHPEAPWLYQSGVRYGEEPPGQDDWQDIPETLALRWGDCEDLACWRIAELRTRGLEYARPHVKQTVLRVGSASPPRGSSGTARHSAVTSPSVCDKRPI